MSERKVLNVGHFSRCRELANECRNSRSPIWSHGTRPRRRDRWGELALTRSYPPDFDPSKIKRRKGINKDAQMTIRLMAPFSMRCQRCGDYICKSSSPSHPISTLAPHPWYAPGRGLNSANCIDKGKKFNARKETAVGEEYYGIKIFRFYIVRLHF